jgi:hypothetical protein
MLVPEMPFASSRQSRSRSTTPSSANSRPSIAAGLSRC